MNPIQHLWWRQAESDHRLYSRLRRESYESCHVLHYLQMATEKLSKAYLWRAGHAPPKAHTGFVRFLRALLTRSERDLERIAPVFDFGRTEDFDRWVRVVLPLAYRLQNIAPAEAGDGPNPEYPWPHANPAHTPVDYTFTLWTDLSTGGHGRHLLDFIDRAVLDFASYA
jgi:HEPN domain-containing protein